MTEAKKGTMGKGKREAQPPQAIRSRIVGEGMEAPDQLLANPQNWRRHPKEQLQALEGMLDAVGWVQRVIVNRTTGHLVDGHARVELALKRDEAQVPVLYVDLSAEEERVVLAALDPIGGLASTDQAMLDELLDGVTAGNEALDALLADLRSPVSEEGLTDPDDTPPKAENPVSRLGDVWVMGRHRIICGSSTEAEVVQKVLAGVKPHLMVTDPPYGVEYSAGWRNEAMPAKNDPKRWKDGAGRAIGAVLNDGTADWREAWALFPGEVAYVWHAGNMAHVVAESLLASGLEIRAQIIWAKHQLVISRGHYHPQHEPCWYAVRKSGTGHWAGDRKQTTLWEIDKPRKSETGHSTQKPVECMKRPIENNSSPGQAVYEPFSGSGTTIIAAEMTGRCCYAVELNPPYVDMAVQRWQNFTGKAATLEGDGRTFAEVEAERLRVEA
jgi:DNA modification methylase